MADPVYESAWRMARAHDVAGPNEYALQPCNGLRNCGVCDVCHELKGKLSEGGHGIVGYDGNNAGSRLRGVNWS